MSIPDNTSMRLKYTLYSIVPFRSHGMALKKSIAIKSGNELQDKPRKSKEDQGNPRFIAIPEISAYKHSIAASRPIIALSLKENGLEL